jgi:hypothetical protein
MVYVAKTMKAYENEWEQKLVDKMYATALERFDDELGNAAAIGAAKPGEDVEAYIDHYRMNAMLRMMSEVFAEGFGAYTDDNPNVQDLCEHVSDDRSHNVTMLHLIDRVVYYCECNGLW